MNPVTGEWVIIAPERSARPILIATASTESSNPSESCPFCAGQEWQTPPELNAYREAHSTPNGPGWRVRVVPNSFAAVKPELDPQPTDDGFYFRAAGSGRHELFVECPQHEANLAHLSVEHVRQVARMWRERLEEASRDPKLHYAQLFKNHGGDAGASVEHAHSQMIATPMIPAIVREEVRFAQEFFERHGECCYCELLRRERSDGSREVSESAGFAAFTAYAGRQPFETWIVPKTHASHLERITVVEADDLGGMLWTILRKLDAALDGPAYNLVFHTAPFHEPSLPYYHWHVEVLPRLTQLAGYEWGTGSHLNPVMPEDAAQVLRETVISSA
jgi:UDPglucose--hexose-1-phosphate uridylyltransferase